MMLLWEGSERVDAADRYDADDVDVGARLLDILEQKEYREAKFSVFSFQF